MYENLVKKGINDKIDQLRYSQTLFGYKRDIFGNGFEYSMLDEKIISWEKYIKYFRWLAAVTTGILVIGGLIQIVQNSNDEPIDYLSKSANFIITTIVILIAYLATKSDLEKAKMIKFLMGLKAELNEEVVEK